MEPARSLVLAIVDHDRITRVIRRRTVTVGFGAESVAVVEGEMGMDAIELRFGAAPVDAMVLRDVLPAMDGPEALAETRRRELAEGLARLPVLMMPAWLLPVDGDWDECLPRPFGPDTFAAAVGRLLGLTPRPLGD